MSFDVLVTRIAQVRVSVGEEAFSQNLRFFRRAMTNELNHVGVNFGEPHTRAVMLAVAAAAATWAAYVRCERLEDAFGFSQRTAVEQAEYGAAVMAALACSDGCLDLTTAQREQVAMMSAGEIRLPTQAAPAPTPCVECMTHPRFAHRH